MGWLFGFKLHLICNECGEFFNFMITPGTLTTVNLWNIMLLSTLSTVSLLVTKDI